MHKVAFKNDSTAEDVCSTRHNREFMGEAVELFKKIGEKNRFKVFARIRYYFDLADDFISTRPSHLNPLEKEHQKSSYYDLQYLLEIIVFKVD